MIFTLPLLLSLAASVICEENVYRAAFDTGVLLANGPDQDQGPQRCENDCAKALQVEMFAQGISFDQNLLSALKDSNKYDSICRFYERQMETCFPKCSQKPANAVVALLQLVCVDKREVLKRNIVCAAQMESTMTTMCVSNCLRRKHSAESSSQLALRQQDTCTRSHCVIKCLGAQITECDLTELKGVYELISGAQMLMGFQRESALELTGERLRSTDVPAKCRTLMQVSYGVMRKVNIPLNTQGSPESAEEVSSELTDDLKMQKDLQASDVLPKNLDLEIQSLPLQ